MRNTESFLKVPPTIKKLQGKRTPTEGDISTQKTPFLEFSDNLYYLQRFYNRCKGKRLSIETIKQYRKVLFRFCNQYSIKDATPDDIRQYLVDLNVSPVTTKIHFMVIRCIYNFLEKEELIIKNPIKKVESPKIPRKTQKFFTDEEIKTLINAPGRGFIGRRDRCIMLTFFGTGLRRSELASLKLQDIRWEEGVILVHGKGSKERKIPLTKTLRRELVLYLKEREKFLQKFYPNPFVFVGSKGNGLTPVGVWDIFKRRRATLGLGRKKSKSEKSESGISPHTWRRTFARTFLKNGGNIVCLQEILGHSDITTTRKYIALTGDDLQEAMENYSPLECDLYKI